jgi:hypothetical protein
MGHQQTLRERIRDVRFGSDGLLMMEEAAC